MVTTMLRIALGADHAGWELKEHLKAWLVEGGSQILDFGTHSADSVDYPDYASAVGDAVVNGKAERGVLVCGTGLGMAMANKIQGVRAAPCVDAYTARMSREHNNANVIGLGARLLDREAAIEILRVWLETAFAGGRHQRRLDRIAEIERRHAGTWGSGSSNDSERPGVRGRLTGPEMPGVRGRLTGPEMEEGSP
jgi:ribose 5-phosphate isomerase B